jgi:subtilisin family serine protease
MPERAWTVAVFDSGIAALPGHAVMQVKRFVDGGDRVLEAAPREDPIGHGKVIAGILDSSPQPVQLLIAQVLNERGRCTAAVLAAALEWAVESRAQLLHFSLGLPADRGVLRAAIARAVAAGMLVVAAAPARGLASYPASYPGVIRATGDARCGAEQISYLGTAGTDFGGCPLHRSRSGKVARGASVGAAYLSRFVVTHLVAGLPDPTTREALIRFAAFHGPERHQPVARA